MVMCIYFICKREVTNRFLAAVGKFTILTHLDVGRAEP